jgi:RNA polymerase sigma factor (sigma-70 family)
MKNFLKQHYDKYYVQTPDGECREVTRRECITADEEAAADCRFKQRWFYDIEAGYIMRLPRNEASEKLVLFNEATLKKEERFRRSKYACAGKASRDCNGQCDACDWYVCSTLELDKPLENGADGAVENYVDIASDDLSPEELFECSERSEVIDAALKKLTERQEEIFRLRYFEELSDAEIAVRLGVSRQSVNKTLRTAAEVLRKTLKDFSE